MLYHSFAFSGSSSYSLVVMIGLAFLVLWSLVWKAFALWHSSRDGSRVWFVAFIIFNTLGILEILYLYVFRKRRLCACPKCGCEAPCSAIVHMHRGHKKNSDAVA